jgi:hypothetical protein
MRLASPVAVRTENRANMPPLSDTMAEIRTWLDSERIEPASFKTVVGRGGLGFEIGFKSEQDADRFRRQFPWLVGAECTQ